MKKIFLLLSVSMIFSFYALTCTIIPQSFCYTNNEYPDRLVASGKIIDIDEDGLYLQIFTVLKGNESRNTIRIWDGTDFECNGPWSMAASKLGQINDSIIVILPLIDSIQNVWDVIGDYRMPDPYSKTPRLKIKNDSVQGFINGYWGSSKIPYADFIDQWETDMGDCSTWVATDNLQPKEPVLWYTNPVESIFTIQFRQGENSEKNLEIFSFNGRKIKSVVSNTDRVEINLSELPNGLYIVRIRERNGRYTAIKVVKV